MFEKAVELRASDIHIEPFRTGLVVRMRVDGLLRNVPVPANVLPQAIISRVKILASPASISRNAACRRTARRVFGGGI